MTEFAQNSFPGFKRAAEAAYQANMEKVSDMERPEERQRIRTLLNSWGNDKILINALAAGKGVEEDKQPWISQYVIDAFRKGEDDIHSALEEGEDNYPGVHPNGFSPTNVGIEYEINVPGIFDFSDENDEITGEHREFFVKNNGEVLVDQETGPRTLELVSDVFPSIDTAVDSILRREKFAEHFIGNNDLGFGNKPIRRHSGDHKSYHPGVHVHVDPAEGSDPEKIEDVLLYYTPQMAFLTANEGEENFEVNGTEYISSRQVKTIGGGYPNGNAVYTDRNTIELRVPDIQATEEDWKATVAAAIGITKYAEVQGFSPSPRINDVDDARDALQKYFEDLEQGGSIIGGRTFEDIVADVEGSAQYFNIDCRIKDCLSQGPSEDEMNEFLDAVDTGLHLAGYGDSNYMDLIEEKVEDQYSKI